MTEKHAKNNVRWLVIKYLWVDF